MIHPTIPWKLALTCCLLALAASAVHAQESGGIPWRTDYNVARKEAEAKNLPMLIDFITTPCFHCDRMKQQTFPDPRVANLIRQRFIPLQLNSRDPEGLKLASHLGIALFPTMVVAGPDGLILKNKVGFQNADELFDMMNQTLAMLTPTDAMRDKFLAAVKYETAGEYVRAISNLRDILDDSKPRPIKKEADELLKKIERRAAERLALAKELYDKGRSVEALEAYTEIKRAFPGLSASQEAENLISKIGREKTEVAPQQRNKRANELIAQAREFYRSKDYVPCLDRCGIVLANYGDLPEGQQAYVLASEIKNNPEWMKNAADVMTDRLTDLWLSLADAHLKSGDVRGAQQYLQRTVISFPGSRAAESAQVRLNQLQGTVPTSASKLAGQ